MKISDRQKAFIEKYMERVLYIHEAASVVLNNHTGQLEDNIIDPSALDSHFGYYFCKKCDSEVYCNDTIEDVLEHVKTYHHQ